MIVNGRVNLLFANALFFAMLACITIYTFFRFDLGFCAVTVFPLCWHVYLHDTCLNDRVPVIPLTALIRFGKYGLFNYCLI